MPYIRAADYARLVAAENACWVVIHAMNKGALPPPEAQEDRMVVATPLLEWAHLAVATGVMQAGDDAHLHTGDK